MKMEQDRPCLGRARGNGHESQQEKSRKKCKDKLFCHENGAAFNRALKSGGISTLKISKT